MKRKSVQGLTVFSLLAQALPAGAEAGPAAIELGLRRTIAIQGQEDERFLLADRMAHYRVPGVSVAVIENCRIVDLRGFGRSAVEGAPVTEDTLFQAGSVSKPVAAVAALRLVEQGRLSLDANITGQLTSWTLSAARWTSGVSSRNPVSHGGNQRLGHERV